MGKKMTPEEKIRWVNERNAKSIEDCQQRKAKIDLARSVELKEAAEKAKRAAKIASKEKARVDKQAKAVSQGNGEDVQKFVWAALGILALVVLLLGGDKESSSPSELDLRLEGRRRLEGSLRDPDSLEIISERIVRKNGKPVYESTFRAKNGFGGYNVETFTTE